MIKKHPLPSNQAPEPSVAADATDWEALFADLVQHFEQQRERPTLFQLGTVVATPGAIELMQRHGISAGELLAQHQSGDWGDVCADDARENALSVKNGLRVLSSYRCGPDQEALWVITEADRSVTTILRPDEY